MLGGRALAVAVAAVASAAVAPAADLFGRTRSGRILACLLLAASVFSAAYPTWNPWTRPWIEQALRHVGAIAGP